MLSFSSAASERLAITTTSSNTRARSSPGSSGPSLCNSSTIRSMLSPPTPSLIALLLHPPHAVCLLLAASRSRCSSRSSTLAQPRARISLTLAATSALVGVRPCHGSGHLPIVLPPLCTGSLGESATQALLHEVRVQLFSLADATTDRPVKLEKLLVL